jgi:hypothetical protein
VEVIASSPDFRPIASRAGCIAAVQEFTATAYFAPTLAANPDSSWVALDLVVSQPERITEATSVISASSTSGRAEGRKVSRTCISVLNSFHGQGIETLNALGILCSLAATCVLKNVGRQPK